MAIAENSSQGNLAVPVWGIGLLRVAIGFGAMGETG